MVNLSNRPVGQSSTGLPVGIYLALRSYLLCGEKVFW
jgi:hypothetical protein